MPICDFGCGKEATHKFKSSGKRCCSTNVNACEGKKAKDSEKKKGKNPFANREHHRAMKGVKPWNAGLKLEDYPEGVRERQLAGIEKSKKTNHTGVAGTPEKEEERRRKISTKMSEVGGGYRKGSGRGKKGWYKGYWCDSSWELAWVIYHLEHGIRFSRNWMKFPYEYNGKTRQWMPDYLMETGEYVEVKGYETEQVKAKLSSFPHVIKIVREFDMAPILEYVISKYGKNFIDRYE